MSVVGARATAHLTFALLLASACGGVDPQEDDPPIAELLPGPSVAWSTLAVRPGANDCLMIPAGVTLVVDDDVTLERLQIAGNVVFADTGARTLEASQISVMGSGRLRAGTASAPFANELDLHLVPGAGACAHGARLNANGSLTNIGAGAFMDHGPQVVMVHDAGRLELFGSDPGPVAVKLVDTAATGDTEIHLPSGTGWTSPAQIVVAPSGFEHDEAEVALRRFDGQFGYAA